MRTALEVSCPACQAPAGSPCTQATDNGRRSVAWVHYSRIDLAKYKENP